MFSSKCYLVKFHVKVFTKLTFVKIVKIEILCTLFKLTYFKFKCIFQLSSRKYYYHRRPIGEPLETYRKPTCLIGDLDMLHRRLTCPIGVRHACGVDSEFQHFFLFSYTFCLFIYIMQNNKLGFGAYRFQMGLQ